MYQELNSNSNLHETLQSQSDYLRSRSVEDRKPLGQFLTNPMVANYMASMLQKPEGNKIKILDAGAGLGILTAETALRLIDFGCNVVHAVAYEIDPSVIDPLAETMKAVEKLFISRKGKFTFEIRNIDFVLDRPDKKEKFDVAVINPPYFKYNVKTSPYAKALSDLYAGDPNIYASFMAIVVASLKDKGQMIAITPRSFTNGLYFKNFRAYLLNNTALSSIHIFKYRNRVFSRDVDKVLQENIICKLVKNEKSDTIEVRASECELTLKTSTIQKYPTEFIVDLSNNQNIIRIPDSTIEAKLLEQAEQLESSFSGSGYFISTGPVVEHRTLEFIVVNETKNKTVPLYRPHNITPYEALWTGEHKKDARFALVAQFEKHLVMNKNYVFLKRFSSKDEKRRLVSGIYLAKRFNDLEFLGIANKVNYIGLATGHLTEIETLGLCAVFNSSFFDRYFRCLSGNTQVNATEVRVMRFPTREQVKEIGSKLKAVKKFDSTQNDFVVNKILKIKEIF